MAFHWLMMTLDTIHFFPHFTAFITQNINYVVELQSESL